MLELVQLADIFRLIVVYWVKDMNWIENIPNLNRSKLLSQCDMLPFVSQALSVVMYIELVFQWNRPSAEAHIDSFIPVVPHILWKPKFLYRVFSRFLHVPVYKEQVEENSI